MSQKLIKQVENGSNHKYTCVRELNPLISHNMAESFRS